MVIIRTLLILLLACPTWTLAAGVAKADLVLVDKTARTLSLLSNGEVINQFRIALGPKPRGHKQQAGDERTPEGQYVLDFKNDQSDFYKSIRISYPNPDDSAYAQARGVDPGGAIMIHGLPNDLEMSPNLVQLYNWTDGCIAVTNEEMDKIWAAVEVGTPIRIMP